MMRVALVTLAVPLLLGFEGGCRSEVPPPRTVHIMPGYPPECTAEAIEAPRLPERDLVVDDVEILARDRKALKGALDRSEGYRSVCRSALEAQSKGG